MWEGVILGVKLDGKLEGRPPAGQKPGLVCRLGPEWDARGVRPTPITGPPGGGGLGGVVLACAVMGMKAGAQLAHGTAKLRFAPDARGIPISGCMCF